MKRAERVPCGGRHADVCKKEASEAKGFRGIHEIIMVCIKCNLAKRMQRCIEARLLDRQVRTNQAVL